MQEFSVFTWNSQGDFTISPKLTAIDSLFGSSRVIGFIQEGGVEKSGIQGRWKAYAGYSVGAYNERCTNYVVVDANYSKFITIDSLTLQDDRERVLVGGGDAGRTPAAIGINDVLFISWHSLADQSNTDTAELIRTIESNQHYAQSYNTVVIGGDFNATPDDIRRVLGRGTDRVRDTWIYKHRYVLNSNQITHPASSNELDFFIVMSKTELYSSGPTANYVQDRIEMVPVEPSDHHPVRMMILV
jgi:hypothetical protein